MLYESFEELRENAYACAMKMGLREHADDIAQMIVLNGILFERKHGRKSKQFLDKAVLSANEKIKGAPGSVRRSEYEAMDVTLLDESLFSEELPEVPLDIHRLHKTEVKFVELIMQGLTWVEIAEELQVSDAKVWKTMTSLKEKLR